jgi:hypothetical protein
LFRMIGTMYRFFGSFWYKMKIHSLQNYEVENTVSSSHNLFHPIFAFAFVR